jgi:hypothetical protein
MVDETGREMQMVEEGRKMKCEITAGIIPARASHFMFVSKTVSIPEDLSLRCDWRTCRSRHGICSHKNLIACVELGGTLSRKVSTDASLFKATKGK